MTATVLYRIDASRRMHRFYRLDVHEAQAALDKQRRAKECRGYSFHFRTELAHGISRIES